MFFLSAEFAQACLRRRCLGFVVFPCCVEMSKKTALEACLKAVLALQGLKSGLNGKYENDMKAEQARHQQEVCNIKTTYRAKGAEIEQTLKALRSDIATMSTGGILEATDEDEAGTINPDCDEGEDACQMWLSASEQYLEYMAEEGAPTCSQAGMFKDADGCLPSGWAQQVRMGKYHAAGFGRSKPFKEPTDGRVAFFAFTDQHRQCPKPEGQQSDGVVDAREESLDAW